MIVFVWKLLLDLLPTRDDFLRQALLLGIIALEMFFLFLQEELASHFFYSCLVYSECGGMDANINFLHHGL